MRARSYCIERGARRRSCLRQHDLQSAVTQRQGLLSDFDDPNVPDVTCFIS